jgi:hypothetical protein
VGRFMSSRVIHLDQKNWIELARGYYGRDPGLQKIAQNVVKKSEFGEAIFPLSIAHFDETLRNMNRERRQRLATYMMLVSQGWAILPASFIFEPEIENACLKQLGLPCDDLQKFAIKKGLSQLVGAKAYLVDRDPIHPLPQELKRKLLETLESPETLLFLMQSESVASEWKELQERSIAETEKFEQIRSSWSRIKDNELRRRATLADYLVKEINPIVVKFLLSIHVNPEVFADKVLRDQEKIIRFFQSMPTSYCLVQLAFYRDMQKMRKVQPNDLNDIMSLSIAIPYSDVVLTETMWQTAIIQTRLNELRPTVVLRSAKELTPFLTRN